MVNMEQFSKNQQSNGRTFKTELLLVQDKIERLLGEEGSDDKSKRDPFLLYGPGISNFLKTISRLI